VESQGYGDSAERYLLGDRWYVRIAHVRAYNEFSVKGLRAYGPSFGGSLKIQNSV
jgi:hypothetical protein